MRICFGQFSNAAALAISVGIVASPAVARLPFASAWCRASLTIYRICSRLRFRLGRGLASSASKFLESAARNLARAVERPADELALLVIQFLHFCIHNGERKESHCLATSAVLFMFFWRRRQDGSFKPAHWAANIGLSSSRAAGRNPPRRDGLAAWDPDERAPRRGLPWRSLAQGTP